MKNRKKLILALGLAVFASFLALGLLGARTLTGEVPVVHAATASTINKGDPCTSGKDCSNGTCQTNNGDCQNDNSDNSDQCSANGAEFAWIICPVISGISKAADEINAFVESQLNFNINNSLGSSTGHIHQAWLIFKNLASGLMIIVMLVMVISQAVGEGPFDAYTVKKLFPRLVAAIIIMQVSWYICIWFIELANAAGQGVAALMAAPFGGTNNLELGQLLTRLSPGWAGATVGSIAAGAGGVGALVAIFSLKEIWELAWPILLLLICFVAADTVAALATLAVRNALIILLVMLSPIAFLAFVMPGADSLWKRWQKEFTRILVFFPMVMAIIYAGRIFAWVFGNTGLPGPIDFIFVLGGFFGPYLFLPKTFQMSGSILGKVAQGIYESKPIKGGKELASKELMDRQKGNMKDFINKHYVATTPGEENGPVGRRQRLQAALKRGVVRTAGGYPIPTARRTRQMLQDVGKWKDEEIALHEGRINNDYKEYQKRGLSVQEAKERIRDKYYNPDDEDSMSNRAFFTWAYDTKSFMEMGQRGWRMGGHKVGGAWVPPSLDSRNMEWDDATKTVRDTKSGRVYTEADLDREWDREPREDMMKSQGWINFMHGNSQAYGDFGSRLRTSVPYRLPKGGGPAAADYLTGGKNATLNPSGNRQAAELLADSARFTKAIDQAEDPSDVVAMRPEQFEELAWITTRLKAGGFKTEGADRLRKFIVDQSQTLAGRNTLQRLSGASQEHINAMFGPTFLQTALQNPRGGPQQFAAGPQTTTQQAGGGGGAAGGGGGGSSGTSRGGTGGGSGAGSGRQPSSTIPGAVISPRQAGPAGPTSVTLKIDHQALADTIANAARHGVRQGFRDINQSEGRTPGGVVLPPGVPEPPTRPPDETNPPPGGGG